MRGGEEKERTEVENKRGKSAAGWMEAKESSKKGERGKETGEGEKKRRGRELKRDEEEARRERSRG